MLIIILVIFIYCLFSYAPPLPSWNFMQCLCSYTRTNFMQSSYIYHKIITVDRMIFSAPCFFCIFSPSVFSFSAEFLQIIFQYSYFLQLFAAYFHHLYPVSLQTFSADYISIFLGCSRP